MVNQIKQAFGKLIFEPVAHTYTLNGENMLSVSKVVDKYVIPFPEDAALKYAIKHNLTEDQVKQSWKRNSDSACDFGHGVHDFGENLFYNHSLLPAIPHEKALWLFWQQHGLFNVTFSLSPVACEARVYTLLHHYAGTFDLLLYDHERQGYIIVDYKTNKDLFKNFAGQMMITPFDFLLDTPYNHYQIQLSLYQIPLQDIGINIIDRWVIWLKPDGSYQKYETYDFTSYLRTDLNT